MVKSSVFFTQEKILFDIGSAISLANTGIFWFFCAAYRCFFSQTRADALKHGFQNIAMLEKLRKCSELFANAMLSFYQ